MRRFTFRSPPPSDFLPNDVFYAPIQAILGERLAPLGFVSPQPGRWVLQEDDLLRPMLEIWHYKGKVSAPTWGFALSCVPHFNNSRTKLFWHRTVKSARLDIFPFDELAGNEWDIPRLTTPEQHAERAPEVLGRATEQAQAYFSSVGAPRDLLARFDRLAAARTRGLGYWNYNQIPLAHAFTLGLCGSADEGRRILDAYLDRHSISGPVVADLRRRYEAARSLSDL